MLLYSHRCPKQPQWPMRSKIRILTWHRQGTRECYVLSCYVSLMGLDGYIPQALSLRCH
jgi:hypothetical protein